MVRYNEKKRQSLSKSKLPVSERTQLQERTTVAENAVTLVGDRGKRFIIFCFLISIEAFFTAYLYYLSVHVTIPSANNAIYQSSSALVFLFSVPLLGESVTISKVLAVFCALGGVVLVSLFHATGNVHVKDSIFGYLLCFGSTALYALYEVLAKKHGPKAESKYEQSINTSALLGMMGAFTLVLLWPGLFIVHALGVEPFELPPNSHITGLICLNLVLDTIFNLSMLLGITLTSPLFISIGSMLVIPTTMLADGLIHGVRPSIGSIGGCALILAAFLLIHFKGSEVEAKSLDSSVSYEQPPSANSTSPSRV
eukprot:c9531_g1_i1.p1 GENE.c9531_g1_i1~~c9531_g1_i1.p1  ORF type:complete len:311 (-),score=40.47 c9531_g1_i1:313-1245(-)